MIVQNERIAVSVGDLANKPIYAVVSDSKSALQSNRNLERRAGQGIVYKILVEVKCLDQHQIRLCLLWVPAYSGILGNKCESHKTQESMTG